MNLYLQPLVKELNHLWTEGFQLTNGLQTHTIYAALIATVNDVPATQKLCGFVGHMANHCCWKCTKSFPRIDPIHNLWENEFCIISG